MTALKLYEATDALGAVYDMLALSQGELTEEIEQALAAAEGAWDEKAERVALFIRELLATAEAVGLEESRLAARRQALNKSAASLKQYLQREMERVGKDAVKRPLATIRLQQSPPRVVLSDGVKTCAELGELARDEWDGLFTTVPMRQQIDNRAVVEEWKAGKPLPIGVKVEQSKHVRIT